MNHRTSALAAACALVSVASALAAQGTTARLSVRVTADGLPLQHAVVRTGTFGAETNAAGTASLALPRGDHLVIVTLLGYAPDSMRLALTRDTLVAVELHTIAAELSGIVVTSGRGAQRIESEPLRVEVLAGDDVAEKTEMRPSDVTRFLAEMAGVRVQQLSAATGASSVRLQGLRPRYTLLLADGLPLYGGSGGGLDLLQLPPADLRQIEVVKGPASALYGPSALGGMINLISKRPGDESDLLFHGTSEQGANAFGWTSKALSNRFGYTAVVGAHTQRMRDTDKDGWADLPQVDRVEARPRLFFDWPGGHSLLVTAGGTNERRAGGIVPGSTAAGGVPYREEVRTRRGDVGLVGHRLVGDRGLLQLRASANVDDKGKLFGNVPENVTRSTGFGELSFGNSFGTHDILGGAAAEVDRATVLEDSTIDYSFTTLSAFAQDAWRFSRFSLTGSARMDHHSRYGTQLSPRLSLLAQLAKGWTTRFSVTQGFYAPTPFVEEADEVGVLRIQAPSNLRVERANYGSLDINGHQGPVELNATFFASRVHHPVTANTDSTSGKYLLTNALLDSRSHGMELFAVYDLEPLFITALYTYTNAHEPKSDLSAAFLSRYVPWHTGGIDVTWEAEETGTWIAVEAFYTGTQPIDDPTLSHGKPHMPIGVLVSQRIGRYKLFVNGENLTNVRQTKYAPLLLPSRAITGEWTTGVWGPLEGRVISVGLRISAGDLAH